MADKVLINLAKGPEDPERVTVAFAVAGAALRHGDRVAMWLTKEAVRLALPGHLQALARKVDPPLTHLFDDYDCGGGELLVCPTCFKARRLDEASLAPNASLADANPMFDWIGDEDATVLSY